MSLINNKAVKELALRLCKDTHRPFTRVSKAFLNNLNATVAETVAIRVHRAPSIGKTLQ